MAIQLLPILRALAPIVANAGTAAASLAGMRNTAADLKSEERMKAVEHQLARLAEVASGLAQQTQAIAQELAAHEQAAVALERKLLVSRWLSFAALGVAVMAVVLARL